MGGLLSDGIAWQARARRKVHLPRKAALFVEWAQERGLSEMLSCAVEQNTAQLMRGDGLEHSGSPLGERLVRAMSRVS